MTTNFMSLFLLPEMKEQLIVCVSDFASSANELVNELSGAEKEKPYVETLWY